MSLKLSLITLFRIFIGVILLAAGISKIMDFASFVRSIELYKFLPAPFVTPAGYLFASAEITLGILLIIGYFSRGSALLSGFLFLAFAIAVTSVVWRKFSLDNCGCANILSNWLGDRPGWKIVSLDIALFIGSIAIAWLRQPGYGVDLITRRD